MAEDPNGRSFPSFSHPCQGGEEGYVSLENDAKGHARVLYFHTIQALGSNYHPAE